MPTLDVSNINSQPHVATQSVISNSNSSIDNSLSSKSAREVNMVNDSQQYHNTSLTKRAVYIQQKPKQLRSESAKMR
jgi:hypothetical protein